MTTNTTTTRPYFTQVTLSVASWGMLKVTRKYFATEEEALVAGALYADRRYSAERAAHLHPDMVGPAMSTLGSERTITADRPFGPLHRNVWTITTGVAE